MYDRTVWIETQNVGYFWEIVLINPCPSFRLTENPSLSLSLSRSFSLSFHLRHGAISFPPSLPTCLALPRTDLPRSRLFHQVAWRVECSYNLTRPLQTELECEGGRRFQPPSWYRQFQIFLRTPSTADCFNYIKASLSIFLFSLLFERF